ncbi:MAG: hypothetical protein SF066_20930 [Thermoanaerobaculia bacterium]|nr:hypothetical protein [Thermoanaerobaculia bacterium]
MKNSRLWLAALAVFAVGFALNFVIHQVWLQPDYQATQSVWRPEAEMAAKAPVMFITGLLFAVLFVTIFSRGYQGRGPMEGVRYGLLVGLLVMPLVAYDYYVVLPIPYDLALKWFLAGLARCAVLGLVAALVYRPARS